MGEGPQATLLFPNNEIVQTLKVIIDIQVRRNDIMEKLGDTTIVSCHFKCTHNKHCKGWATHDDVTVGERTNCYFLNDVDWSNGSPSNDKNSHDMWVVSLVTNPLSF